MRSLPQVLGLVAGIGLLVSWPGEAHALTATAVEALPTPLEKGGSATFEIVVEGALGPVQVRWDFGDGTVTELTNDDLKQTHSYPKAGHFSIVPLVSDGLSVASVTIPLTVHEPLTAQKPTASSDLVYDQASHRVYVANYENDSISAVDTVSMTTIGELPVSRGPVALALAPQGKLWVLHRDAHAIAIVDTATFSVSSEVMLPYASQPMGLALSPAGDVAYVSLMAVGKLLKLDVATGAVLGEVAIGSARGVSVSADGTQVYVTRFITSDEAQGEVVRVDAATLAAQLLVFRGPVTRWLVGLGAS
jgi:YVTN family beta-propeller protein